MSSLLLTSLIKESKNLPKLINNLVCFAMILLRMYGNNIKSKG